MGRFTLQHDSELRCHGHSCNCLGDAFHEPLQSGILSSLNLMRSHSCSHKRYSMLFQLPLQEVISPFYFSLWFHRNSLAIHSLAFLVYHALDIYLRSSVWSEPGFYSCSSGSFALLQWLQAAYCQRISNSHDFFLVMVNMLWTWEVNNPDTHQSLYQKCPSFCIDW